MTPTAPQFPSRRSRLAIARDLVVVGLCALVVAGFLFDVAGGAPTARPAASSTRFSS
ncbi:MAG: hypothetical protein IPO09_05440 [Anaeromyxobacter sp.]|nr:hypothetical protein [Anaeromyxobacter sp.]MBL0277407.1 hypothetical protein [Anaeromyxobacter sp.]